MKDTRNAAQAATPPHGGHPLRLATPQERAELIDPLFDIAAVLYAIVALGDELADNGAHPQDAGDAMARLATRAREQLVDVINRLDA